MNKQKFHSLLLAAGVVAENFHVEELVADPIVTRPGRFWVNSTTNKVRYSKLESDGSVSIHSISSEADVAAAIQTLQNTLVSEVTKLNGDVAAETQRAIAAEQGLSDRISAEAARASDAEVALGNRLTTELGSATAQLQSAITAEQDRAVAAETLLAGRVGVVETTYATKAEVASSISALGNAFEYVGTVDGNATPATAFDLAGVAKNHPGAYYKVARAGYVKLGSGDAVMVNELDGILFNALGGFDVIDNTDYAISGVAGFTDVTGSKDTGYQVDLDAAFKGRVSTLETGLAGEVVRATAAETQLGSDLTAEVARAQSAEAGLAAKQASDNTAVRADLQAEVTRATGAEGALDTRIVQLEAKATGAVGNLADLHTDAKENVVAAINEVQDEVEAEKQLRIAQGGDFAARLTLEENTRAQGDQNLLIALDGLSVSYQQADATEKAERIAGDQAGADALAAHVVVYGDNKVATDNRITALENKGVADVAALQSSIDAEVSRATGAEAGLNGRLTVVENNFASKELVDAKFAALGSAFEYVGVITADQFDVSGEFNTATLLQKDAGDYYQVKATGTIVHGTQRVAVNAGDAFVFNKTGGIEKFDNTDPNLQGTADEINVVGSVETGFTVSLSETQKTRISNLETNLSAETTRAQGIEAGLQSGLTAEVARAQAAESDLQNKITTEASRAVNREDGLQSSLDALAAAVAANNSDVKGLIDSRVKNWASNAPALTHTVTHAFGHSDFVYVVSVQGDDGFYRNDVVPVEFASNNAIVVTLSESRNIKVSFSSTAPVQA